MNNKSQEKVVHFKAKLYCGSTFGESTEATLNLEGSGVHHSDLAAFVTKAVNCHDDLLEACKLVERAHVGDGVQMSTAVDACLLAIEKASAQ